MIEKAFTFYELLGTHPNITVNFVDVQVAKENFEELKALCDSLCLTKYEYSKADGYLLSPEIEVLENWKENKNEFYI